MQYPNSLYYNAVILSYVDITNLIDINKPKVNLLELGILSVVVILLP